MNNNPTNKTTNIRFRRWSRAGFAAFVSLKREVTIGVLSSNVCEKSTAKQALLLIPYNNPSDASEEEENESHQTKSALLQEELFSVICNNSIEKACAPFGVTLNIFINQRLYSFKWIQPFFISRK